MTEIQKERYRKIRGNILRVLIKWHPAPLDSKEIHVFLDDLGYSITKEELESHLSYLEEPGYIQIEKRKAEGFEIRKIRIMKKGIDIIDKFTSDIGIDVRF
jgi:repressor of nif and glnA expression